MTNLRGAIALSLGLMALTPIADISAKAPPTAGDKPPIGVPTTTTTTYDQMGMPRIVGGGAVSGYSELCYDMAKDRLFQMDLLRRSAYGRLAEIFGGGPGNSLLQQDLTLRAQDIATHADRRFSEASPDTKKILFGCSVGINRFIDEATQTGALPIEFSVLAYAPEQWRPQDSVALLMYLGSGFSNIGTQTKLQRAAVAGVFGPEIAGDLIPTITESSSMFDANGEYHPPSVSPAIRSEQPQFAFTAPAGADALASFKLPRETPNALGFAYPRFQATNSFVVDGTRTESGKPILANDPHLGLTTPSAFYFAQLDIRGEGGFNIRGATIPGAPIFLSAQNEAASWGISIAGIDDTDLYLETVTKLGETEYVTYRGGQVPVTSRYETVRVAGQDSVQLRVRTTPHGALLNDAMPALNPFGPISIKATFSQPEWKVDGYFSLPGVQGWSQFKSALARTGIGLNFIYADGMGASGNIGYQMAGLMPQRNAENLYFPVSGADAQHEWTGFATPDQHPSVLNPSNHFIVAANNRIVPSNYAPGGVPVSVGGFLEQPWRMTRAAELLYGASSEIVPADLMQMQTDTHNAVGKEMANLYVSALQSTGLPVDDPDAAASLVALEAWNGNADSSSSGALIYEVMTTLLIQDTASNVIGPDFYQNYVQGIFVTRRVDAIRNLLATPHAPFFGIQANDDAVLKRNLAVQTALAKADKLLRSTLGTDRSAWTWGQLHTLTYNHPLANAPIPGNPFALPTYSATGDFATLNIGWWGTQAGLLALPADVLAAAGGPRAAFAQDALAAIRVAWDQESPFGAVGVLSTGQNGSPFSPHWIDQGAIWRADSFRPLSYDGIETY